MVFCTHFALVPETKLILVAIGWRYLNYKYTTFRGEEDKGGELRLANKANKGYNTPKW